MENSPDDKSLIPLTMSIEMGLRVREVSLMMTVPGRVVTGASMRIGGRVALRMIVLLIQVALKTQGRGGSAV